MGTRTETYITCDQCRAEKLTTRYCPNKKAVKLAAIELGFITTTKNEFCSDECKRTFKDATK